MAKENNNLFTMLLALVQSKGINTSQELSQFISFPTPYTTERKDSQFAKIALENAIRIIDDPEIGLKLAEFISPNVFNKLGYLFMTAGNLTTAFEKVAALPALYHDVVKIVVSETDSQLEVMIENRFEEGLSHQIVDEGAIAILVNYMGWVIPEAVASTRITFAHEALTTPERYFELLGVAPTFGADKTGMFIDKVAANATLHSADEEYHQHLWQKLFQIQAKCSDLLSDKVKAVIRDNLPQGTHGKQHVADIFSMSEKTLDRRLADEGTNYRELVTKTRIDLATVYLSNDDYSLDDIAEFLGYQDRSAFSKAYKRWTGKSPRS